MILNLIPTREELIRERERERLQRYLFIKFGRKKFDFYWTDAETSYTDYSSIYVKYNLQTPYHQNFTPEEMRILRKGHAIHERGHIEYDISGITQNWRLENSSVDRNDWASNHKYPLGWLEYFSGMMVDVRMENFVIIDQPEAKEYLDFCNYNWRFGIRGSNAGENRINDFRECLASRGFNLIDIPEWHPEAVELVDSVQHIIKDVQFSHSTQEAMDNTGRLLKEVWPTLYSWMMQDDNGVNDLVDEKSHDSHNNSTWGDPDFVEQNTDRVMGKIQAIKSENTQPGEGQKTNEDGEDNEPASTDFKRVQKIMASEMKKDEEAADDEVGPYKECKIEVEVNEKNKHRNAYSDQVLVTPFDQHNVIEYLTMKKIIQRQINPTAAVLKKLLDPTPDKKSSNQRSGRLDVSKVWAASKLEETNVFKRLTKGAPAVDARILVLTDISGSTSQEISDSSNGIRRIDAMKQALVLLSEATETAKVPTSIYAFTEDVVEDANASQWSTIIFPLKPYGRLTDIEKGFIGGIEPKDGNRDTMALQWAVNELSKFDEDIRLLIVLSDGEPNFYPHEDGSTMRAIVHQAKRKGIDVVCLFIGPIELFENVKEMYPGGAVFVTNSLARDLTHQMRQIIARRRK